MKSRDWPCLRISFLCDKALSIFKFRLVIIFQSSGDTRQVKPGREHSLKFPNVTKCQRKTRRRRMQRTKTWRFYMFQTEKEFSPFKSLLCLSIMTHLCLRVLSLLMINLFYYWKPYCTPEFETQYCTVVPRHITVHHLQFPRFFFL